MTRVLVTGATGNLGRLCVESLLRARDAGQALEIAALARRPELLSDLHTRGVDVRMGDYTDAVAMRQALDGVDRLVLISAPTFTDRALAHRTVIAAAVAASVEHVLYTSVQGQPDGRFTFSEVTASDVETIAALARSGLRSTVAYNALFLDSLLELIGDEPATAGTLTVPAGAGAVAPIARRDLAEAYAAIVTSAEPAPRYTLTGPRAVTMPELAAVIGDRSGRPVNYRPVSADRYVAARVAAGVPEPVAAFMAQWFLAIAAGEFPATTDFETLVGRPAQDVTDLR